MLVKLPSGEIVNTAYMARIKPTDPGCTITWAPQDMPTQRLEGEDAEHLLAFLDDATSDSELRLQQWRRRKNGAGSDQRSNQQRANYEV